MTQDPLRKVIADNTTAPELVEMTEQLVLLRTRLEMAEDEAKRIRGNYEQVEAELFDALENAGLRSIRTDKGLFLLNDLAWAKVADPEAAKEWADQNAPELLTLNLQRLSKIVRETLKGEREGGLPAGVDYTTSRKINWRRQP
jgi:hypothetical protein